MNRQNRNRFSPSPKLDPPHHQQDLDPSHRHQSHLEPFIDEHKAQPYSRRGPNVDSDSNPDRDVNPDSSQGWYSIKRIVDARVDHDSNKEYLVEWEPVKGARYRPEWVAEDCVTEEALQKWEKKVNNKKKKRAPACGTPTRGISTSGVSTRRTSTWARPNTGNSPQPEEREGEEATRRKFGTPDLFHSSTDDGQSVGPDTPTAAPSFAPTNTSASVLVGSHRNTDLNLSESNFIAPTQISASASQATKCTPSQERSVGEPSASDPGHIRIVDTSDAPELYNGRIIPDSQDFSQDSISTLGHWPNYLQVEPGVDPAPHQPNPLAAAHLPPPIAIEGEGNKPTALQAAVAEGALARVEGLLSPRPEARQPLDRPLEDSSVRDSEAAKLSGQIADSHPGLELAPTHGESQQQTGSAGVNTLPRLDIEIGDSAEGPSPRLGPELSTFPSLLLGETESLFPNSEAATNHESRALLPEASSLGPPNGNNKQEQAQEKEQDDQGQTVSETFLDASQAAQRIDGFNGLDLRDSPFHTRFSISPSLSENNYPDPGVSPLAVSHPPHVVAAAAAATTATATVDIMDNSVTDMPMSAVEELRRMQAQAYRQIPQEEDPILHMSAVRSMELAPATISPADIMPPTAADQAATFMSQSPGDMPISSLSMSQLQHDSNLNLVLGQDPEPSQITVSPADVTTRPVPATSRIRRPDNTVSPTPSDDMDPSRPSHLAPVESQAQTEYLVTLPFQASRRAVYVGLHSEYRQALKGINTLNAMDTPVSPDPQLIANINEFFEKLLDVCDLPDIISGMDQMPYHNQKMHALQTNCKFSFVHELLQHIREFDRTVLIICREGPVFGLLCALLETAGCKFIIHEEKEALDGLDDPTIVLASSDQEVDGMVTDFDCVIEFDYSCRTSELAHQARTIRNKHGRLPLILTLVVSYSLEHIYSLENSYRGFPRPEPTPEFFDKSAIAIALYNCLPFLKNPRRGYHEPPELGIIFGELLRNPVTDIDWSPTQIPDDVFDIFSSQSGGYSKPSTQREDSTAPSVMGRKRQLDYVDDDPSKRIKLVMRDGTSQAEPMVSAEIQELRDKVASLQTSLESKTNALKAKGNSEYWYKKQCAELRANLDSHIRTIRDTANHYSAVLQDRGLFEYQAKESLENQKIAEQTTEIEKAKSKTLDEKIVSLESQLAEMRDLMAGSATPDVARLAILEKSLKAAEEKGSKAERSAEHAKTDLEYARTQYQNASRAASDLAAENQDLKTQCKDLTHKASENLRRIHEINTEQQVNEMGRRVQEQEIMIGDRDKVIKRLEEALVVVRMNQGRRDTRQNSVPRSPRPSGMSPRPMGGGRTLPGAGSRGGSPAPNSGGGAGAGAGAGGGYDGMGMGIGHAAGGARWPHLRD